jgi:hypothetical protein
MDNNENRLSAAYSVAEAERFQGVTISDEQFKLFDEVARDRLAEIVCKRRGWLYAEFAGVEQKKDGTVRVLYRKLDVRPVV